MDAKTALQPQITSFACDEIYRLTSIPHATESERTLVAITFNIRAEEKKRFAAFDGYRVSRCLSGCSG